MRHPNSISRIEHTGVIEFTSLANAQTTGTNDQDLLHVNEVAASLDGTAVEVRLSSGSLLGLGQATDRAGEGAQLLGASRRGELLQAQGRCRGANGGLRGESAERQGRASLNEASLAQEGGSLPTTSCKNHGGAKASETAVQWLEGGNLKWL